MKDLELLKGLSIEELQERDEFTLVPRCCGGMGNGPSCADDGESSIIT